MGKNLKEMMMENENESTYKVIYQRDNLRPHLFIYLFKLPKNIYLFYLSTSTKILFYSLKYINLPCLSFYAGFVIGFLFPSFNLDPIWYNFEFHFDF